MNDIEDIKQWVLRQNNLLSELTERTKSCTGVETYMVELGSIVDDTERMTIMLSTRIHIITRNHNSNNNNFMQYDNDNTHNEMNNKHNIANNDTTYNSNDTGTYGIVINNNNTNDNTP